MSDNMRIMSKECIECGEEFEVLEKYAYGIQLCHKCRIDNND